MNGYAGKGNGTARQVAEAFVSGRAKRAGHGATDGHALSYRGNVIARRCKGGFEITDAGWPTMTTRRWLNCLPNVSVYGEKGRHRLNGQVWDGTWMKIEASLPKPQGAPDLFDFTEVSTVENGDYWRPYTRPKYAVCGANDTGGWSDSPCRTEDAQAELERAKAALTAEGIPVKARTLNSSNVFMVRHFLVAKPKDYQRARTIVEPLVETAHLLYLA